MKYYKDGRIYYCVEKYRTERVYFYHYYFGIENSNQQLEQEGEIEITEAQYKRARRLILKKLES